MDDDNERLRSLSTIGLISYLLHLLVAVAALVPGGQWGPTLLIVALVLDLVKRADARGTWHESHFRWRIQTVAWVMLAYLVTLPLSFLFLLPGWLAWTAISAWFLYRIVKGMARFNASRPMELNE
ncbi:MAG: hypothetical protein RJA36_2286 [Pseudomonadota bacterium]|jgi:uncharacterized membrane protein